SFSFLCSAGGVYQTEYGTTKARGLLGVLLGPMGGGPAGLCHLPGPGNGQGVRLYVLGNGGTGGGVGPVPDVDGGDQIGVAADKAVVPNGGAVLPVAVVVDQHRAAAKVDLPSHVGVAHIGQVGDLGPLTDG